MKARLLLSLFFLATLTAAPAAAQQTPPATALAGPAAAAAARLRQLFFQADFDGAYAEGAGLIARFPAEPAVRGWWIMAEVAAGRPQAALAHADSLARAFPGDFWSDFCRAFVLSRGAAERLAGAESVPALGRDSALAALARVRSAKPDDPDVVWLEAIVPEGLGLPDEAIAAADSAIARGRATTELLVVKGRVLAMQARGRPPDSALAQRAAAVLDQALRLDSTNVDALTWAGIYGSGDAGVRQARLHRAVQLAPYSLQVHQVYWAAMRERPEAGTDDKTAAIAADAEALLRARGDVPRVLLAVARVFAGLQLTERARAIEDTLRARWPQSPEAEEVLFTRAVGPGVTADSAGRARRLQSIRDFLALPVHHDARHRQIALAFFFGGGFDLAAIPDSELVRNADAIGHDRLTGEAKIQAARVLADRGVGLAVAERLAREAAAEPPVLDDRRGPDGQPLPDSVFRMIARDHQLARQDALGWVLVAEGRLAEADSVLTLSRGRFPSALMLYHAGRLEEKRGNLAAAQGWYEQGFSAEPFGYPGRLQVQNEPELRRVYLERHGSSEGYAALVDSLRAKQPRMAASASRGVALEKPEPFAPFALSLLGGGTLRSDTLLGKVVVVDFWGTWCAPCLVEMPAFQAFWEHYRSDPAVRLVTIAAHDDRTAVRDFMTRRKFDFPVLLDDGYADRAGVAAFPTTWVVDRQGRKAYRLAHADEQELTRLVELLKSSGQAAKTAPDR